MAQTGLSNRIRAIVIGGSTGSIEVLLRLLPALKEPLSYALVIVIHRRNTADSALADLLAVKTNITVREIDDKDTIEPGIIYLAPADYHLLIEQDGTFSLDDSEKVNYSRPSIDVTFESAADVYGRNLVGVILSGANADGTVGLKAIKKEGGVLVAQKPETAQIGFMPQQAILHADVDLILDVDELVEFMNELNK
jgi:two-component system chemotaxis response regulator CheB